MYAQKERLIE